ncbi:MAG: Stp1/IreP family PP2C-type Ser/Thr phosphatase [Bacilli bacterium]|nr:Stp1/IreP family PP2C-type Ser/Thr phosphatase [Bacilli bacterium]
MSKVRYKGTICFKTDQGRVRLNNEDQSLALVNHEGDVLLVVCDGMGGQNKGDYASKIAIETMEETFSGMKSWWPLFAKRNYLMKCVREANNAIFSEAEKNIEYKDMGTTIVAAYITGDKIVVVNIGDSRAYMLDKKGNLTQLTQDQTYVDYLYRTGKIDESQTKSHPDRHVLMNALGIFPSVAMDVRKYKYQGESILLCSDGLYNNVQESSIKATLRTDERPDQKVDMLINEANQNGGSDNIGISYWEAIDND